VNVFTVDVEEWFHICGVDGPLATEHWPSLPSRVVDTTHRLLDELEHAGVRAGFFVVGWVAERHPELVQAIRGAGHEVGSHSYLHRRVYELEPDAFARDVQSSVSALRACGVERVTMFRAPEWSINDRSLWALCELARLGFRVDASMAPVALVGSPAYPRRPHVRATADGTLVEVPPFVVDRWGQAVPIGWGWALRMSRPRRVLDAIETQNRSGVPAVLTVHPWEIDPDPPRVRLSPRLHFAHYFRLDGFLDRLREVLRGAPFTTLGSVAATAEHEA
jgi:peptidoglycan-N-acetylglucosamine deacetylase